MISRRRFAAAIALLFVCGVLSVVGEARFSQRTKWDGRQVLLVAGAAVSLLVALGLVGTERQ